MTIQQHLDDHFKNNEVKFNNCPFCDTDSEFIFITGKTKTRSGDPFFFVKCENCGASAGSHNHVGGAIDNWNIRESGETANG